VDETDLDFFRDLFARAAVDTSILPLSDKGTGESQASTTSAGCVGLQPAIHTNCDSRYCTRTHTNYKYQQRKIPERFQAKLSNGKSEEVAILCDDGQWFLHDTADVDCDDCEELTDASDASVLAALPYDGTWTIVG